MRPVQIFAGVAALAFTMSASAQEAGEQPPSGISDLSDTVDKLSDDQPAASTTTADPEEPAPEALPAERNETGQAEAEERTPDSSPSRSAAPSGPPLPLDSAQLAELDRIAARGRQLFAIARAGLLGTQDMLSRVADPNSAGISGWVAEPEGNAMAVTFYGDGDIGPVAIYRVRVLGARAVSRETFLTGDRPALSGLALRLARARAATESDDLTACTRQPFNVIAVPPEAVDGPIDIYRISAPESPERLPLGGHFRSTVAADGSVSETRAFSRGCLNVDVGAVRPGTQAGPIAITHLLDPIPTEIHVFLSMFAARPLVIAAGDPTRLFMVAGDSIREIRR